MQNYSTFWFGLERTPEDLVMQLLVLKLLYLLFTTKGTCEFFYTNDLCVLVDVFLREILDLDEDNESVKSCPYASFVYSTHISAAAAYIPTSPPSSSH